MKQQKSTFKVLLFSVIIARYFRNDCVESSSSSLASTNRPMILSLGCPTIFAYVSSSATVVADDSILSANSRGCAVPFHMPGNSTIETSFVLGIIFDYCRWSLRCRNGCLLILREGLLLPPVVVPRAFVGTVLWPCFRAVLEKRSVRWLRYALIAVSFKARC